MRGIRILCMTTATAADFRLSSVDVLSLTAIDVYCGYTC